MAVDSVTEEENKTIMDVEEFVGYAKQHAEVSSEMDETFLVGMFHGVVCNKRPTGGDDTLLVSVCDNLIKEYKEKWKHEDGC